MCRIDLIRPFFFQQWFPKATTTTSWKSTSREASGWTTRKPVPSSCPSVCPWMTILQRPWETSGCRSNPSPLPVRPRLQAAQVLLIHRPTATARASPTKRLPEACRQFPAIGLSTENQEMLPVWGEYGLYNVKTFHWVQLRLGKGTIACMSQGELWNAGVPQDFAGPNWNHIDAQRNVAKIHPALLFHISVFRLLIRSELPLQVMWADKNTAK